MNIRDDVTNNVWNTAKIVYSLQCYDFQKSFTFVGTLSGFASFDVCNFEAEEVMSATLLTRQSLRTQFQLLHQKPRMY
jgi:hypothetical protein